ncbi:hypothetical protein BJ875DRAFT_112812 [Amylocarpus encephaloides]|uniref:Cupin type-2 domain-containing protein n=1 Tax=Amylocarpus encephaloides TaxID=45428 RepID=A0A9P7YD82_9HELO|nr:hypothetical protein BJ875DRAFT_112812 [Amylocarpus encephaloides]
MSSPLPPVVFHNTANAPDGTSSFIEKTVPPIQAWDPSFNVTYIYSAPAGFSVTANEDLKHHETAPKEPPLRSFPIAGATNSTVLDLAPNPTGEDGFMHRTRTLDFIYVLTGEVELTLGNGEKRMIQQGEIVLQRATMHAWKNASKTEWARLAAVVIGETGAEEGKVEVE